MPTHLEAFGRGTHIPSFTYTSTGSPTQKLMVPLFVSPAVPLAPGSPGGSQTLGPLAWGPQAACATGPGIRPIFQGLSPGPSPNFGLTMGAPCSAP